MVASLRRWGGRLASAPIIAVTPRLGPPLRRRTREQFSKLNVAHVRRHVRQRYAWYPFMNKVSALRIAEPLVASDVVAWLDSDLLFAGEPDAMLLDNETDIAACPASRHGGTTGPGDPNEASWRAMAEAVGLSLDALPWVNTEQDAQRVRFYFNAGVFAYRKGRGFLESYLRCVERVLDARVSEHSGRVGLLEQAAFSLSILKAGLRYERWSDQYNYSIGRGLERYYQPTHMQRAAIVHYHTYMSPTDWPQLLALLREDQPRLHGWLSAQGPIIERRFATPSDCLRTAFKLGRCVRRSWFARRCQRSRLSR